MFMCPAEWREWRNGDLMTYVPREGKAHCTMTYVERVCPVRSLRYLLYRVLDEEPEFVTKEIFQPARFLSVEGEYGARIVVKGESRGVPIAFVVAALFTEDFSTRLVGRIEPEHLDKYVDMITTLAQHDRLGLGLRRRRVAFQPPQGWHPVVGTLDCSLFPPDYPKPRAVITVSPAEPIAASLNPKDVIEEHDARVGLPRPEESQVTPAHTPRKLRGELIRTVRPLPGGAGKMLRHMAVLRDNTYWYSAKMEALEQPGLEPITEVFMNVVGSIESIPTPQSNVVVPTAFNWVD